MSFNKKIFLNIKKNSNFNISKQILYEQHNLNFSPTFGQFFISCFLTLLSLFGILIAKLRGIKKAHYFIIPWQSEYPYIDKRAQEITKIIGRNKILNLVKSVSTLNSLKFFCLYPNTIFLYSILDIILFFNYKHKNNIKKNCEGFHICNKKFKIFIKKIFKFLKIQKFIMVDDHRWACMFQQICKETKITSIGYMHGKFHKIQIGLRLNTFDNYILWDYFFKTQLLGINELYKKKNFFFLPHHGLNKKFIKKNKKIYKNNKIKILYVYEEKVDFQKIFPILEKLSKEKKIEIDIKIRKNTFLNEGLIDFAIENKINLIDENNLNKVFSNNYNFTLAHNSTLLYESFFFNVIPVRIVLKRAPIEDQISDNFFIKITYNLKNYYNFFSKLKRTYKLSKNKKLIWYYHLHKFPKNNDQIVRKLLTD